MTTNRISPFLGQSSEPRTAVAPSPGFVVCPAALMLALPLHQHAEIARIYAAAREQVRLANAPSRPYVYQFSDN